MTDPIEQFQQDISAAGLPPPDTINADGVLHRFSTNGNWKSISMQAKKYSGRPA